MPLKVDIKTSTPSLHLYFFLVIKGQDTSQLKHHAPMSDTVTQAAFRRRFGKWIGVWAKQQPLSIAGQFYVPPLWDFYVGSFTSCSVCK